MKTSYPRDFIILSKADKVKEKKGVAHIVSVGVRSAQLNLH